MQTRAGDRTFGRSAVRGGCLLVVSLAMPFVAAASASAGDDRVGLAFFESKIRPVLVEKCHQCHSNSSPKPKGGLLVDTRAGIRKGGNSGPAVVPGDLDASLLYQAISGSDGVEPMPPKGKLPVAVVADFRQWIKMGAPDPRERPASAGSVSGGSSAGVQSQSESNDWWSLRPLAKPAVPKRDSEWAAWARTPVDTFVLAKLREHGLHPAAEADRRTLIRRLSFDLLGLPPSREEVDAFDQRPIARCLRAAGRSPACEPALRRAVGAALDGPGPFRRDARPRPGPDPAQCLAVSRLPDLARSTATRPMRRFVAGAGRRRCALSRRAGAGRSRSGCSRPGRGTKARCATFATTASIARSAITSTATTWSRR